MRVYALLLGILLTTGYGYAAQIAVSSLGPSRQTATVAAAATPASDALDGVWYGGVLDPVTVESRSGSTRAASTPWRVSSPPTVRSTEAYPGRSQAASPT